MEGSRVEVRIPRFTGNDPDDWQDFFSSSKPTTPADDEEEEEEDDLPPPALIGSLESRWWPLVRDGNMAIVAEEIRREEAASPVVNKMPPDHFWLIARDILCSISDELMEVICSGNVMQARQNNDMIRKQLELNETECNKQPTIYMLELTKKHTLDAPSPNELLAILDCADKYAGRNQADMEFINSIDNAESPRISMEQTRAGFRKYFKTTASDPNATKPRGEYRKLRDKMRALFVGLGEDQMRKAMTQPLREVGYATKGLERLKQHYNHNSSNYLMNLFDAIVRVKWPGRYQIRGNIIYRCWEGVQGSIAEIVLSVIGSAYTKTGRGFCHQPAGQSNTTSWKGDWKWLQIQLSSRYQSTYYDKMKRDNEKLAAWYAKGLELVAIEKELAEIKSQLGPSEDSARRDDRLRQDLADLHNQIEMIKLLNQAGTLDPE